MQNIFQKMNEWGSRKIPFLFIIDYEMQKPLLYKLSELPENILLDFPGFRTKIYDNRSDNEKIHVDVIPVSRRLFNQGFSYCKEEIQYGNSFLLNLTFPSEIITNYSLEKIFKNSSSEYKICLKNNFVSFSPEIFVKINNGKIYSYPMKGTIDASIPQAKDVILNNKKETAEHYTIVDLIRNDLSRVSEHVRVSNFRYIQEVQTQSETLLQVSSEIQGDLPIDWNENIGSIFQKLLPAGSISGAPKTKTLEIIKKAELDERGYYTGIAGIYDGHEVDSCVLIRYIEKKEDQYLYRSGGGITFQSDEEEEYQELIQKIYVPIF